MKPGGGEYLFHPRANLACKWKPKNREHIPWRKTPPYFRKTPPSRISRSPPIARTKQLVPETALFDAPRSLSLAAVSFFGGGHRGLLLWGARAAEGGLLVVGRGDVSRGRDCFQEPKRRHYYTSVLNTWELSNIYDLLIL